jgi:hypothetical protein
MAEERSGTPEPDWKRRARLARIFGDALSESTSDDRDDPAEGAGGSNDARLRRDVPPHHGS